MGRPTVDWGLNPHGSNVLCPSESVATELIIVLVIVLIIFGPKRLPQLGRSLGGGMREFKDSVTGNDKDDDERRGHRVPARQRDDAPPPRDEETETARRARETKTADA